MYCGRNESDDNIIWNAVFAFSQAGLLHGGSPEVEGETKQENLSFTPKTVANQTKDLKLHWEKSCKMKNTLEMKGNNLIVHTPYTLWVCALERKKKHETA